VCVCLHNLIMLDSLSQINYCAICLQIFNKFLICCQFLIVVNFSRLDINFGHYCMYFISDGNVIFNV